jgi:hypothetical protein
MKHNLQLIALLSVLPIATSSFAQDQIANIKYEFTIYSSYPTYYGDSFSGAFAFLSQGFIDVDVSSTTFIPPQKQLYCSATASSGAPTSCGTHNIAWDSFVDSNVLNLHLEVVDGGPPNRLLAYYFDPRSLTTVGLHNSTILGPEQFATVSVSVIPEPATYLLFLIAGVCGLARKFRSR